MDFRSVFRITAIPAVVASLCCLSPVLLFSAGVISLSVAAELADVLYWEYKWIFRSAGLLMLVVFLIFYFRRKNICTLDTIARRRREVLNTVLIAIIAAVLFYIVFLYGIVELVGWVLGIW